MRRCPDCKSVWVCWNAGRPSDTEWWHECHNCSCSFVTPYHVDDGVPYETLMQYGEFFVEPGLFDKKLSESMMEISTLMGAKYDTETPK